MFKVIGLLIASVVGAIIYRMGGSDEYNTKWRDLGIPTLVTIVLLCFGPGFSGSILGALCYFLTFGLVFAAQTTYFKQKGQDAKAWNWMLVGLANGLALAPYTFLTGQWLAFVVRTVALIIMITAWSEWKDNAIEEELGRGFLIIATLSMFCW